ncbi:hypothetical protein GCM10023196_107830 [Actinoallomurus vinaceus]|uniref:Uncharacterized protein n=1 Tax=Actinoallomurus vinaceus TaxID=1080074 RepID=A0ABP8UX90_9ACTN
MQMTDVGGQAALRARAPLLAIRLFLRGGAGRAERMSADAATGTFLNDDAGGVREPLTT